MAIQKRIYTVDDVLELQCQPGNGNRHYELINGELIELSPTNHLHGWLVFEIGWYLRGFVKQRNLGYVSGDVGFYPTDDRLTLLAPDVAFVRKDRLPSPHPLTFVGFMPNLAVEVKSSSNTMAELRRKTAIYLRNGTELVWIVKPEQMSVDVCRADDDEQISIEPVELGGILSGEHVLPGFELELRELFAELNN